MKTSELTGAALDWAAAIAEGWTTKRCGMACDCVQYVDTNGRVSILQSYSTDWSLAGPIIERENISLERPVRMRGCAVIGFHDWRASHPKNYGGLIRYHGDGPTALVAAMRCYVASKLGNEVEIPEGL